jgi:hypothetical protein
MIKNLFTYDVHKARKDRQIQCYNNAHWALNNSPNYKEFLNNRKIEGKDQYNIKEVERVLEYTENSYEDIREEFLHNELFADILSMRISTMASRGGKIDELAILEGIGDSMISYGIEVKPTATTELQPIKDGGLMSLKEAKEKGLYKEKNGLKTIDGTFNVGNKSGYIFAKVCIGKGGHQDNVSIESAGFIEWALKHDKKKIYVILIDGNKPSKDLLNNTKEHNNIWIVDHVQFQEKLLELL